MFSEVALSDVIVAGGLTLLAVVHSILGEAGILAPLFRQDWQVDEPRWAVERILRFAWHLTSIAWLALAAIVVGADLLGVVAAFAAVSAAIIFVMLRGHLAWPLFLLVALAAARGAGLVEGGALQVAAGGAAVALLLASALHVYWALGGRWIFDIAAPPIEPGARFSQPGRLLTLAVAGALAAFSALTTAVALNRGPAQLEVLLWIGVGVLTVRAIGDTKAIGFSKTDRSSAFAQADDRWFSQIVVFLALGVSAAGLLG